MELFILMICDYHFNGSFTACFQQKLGLVLMSLLLKMVSGTASDLIEQALCFHILFPKSTDSKVK